MPVVDIWKFRATRAPRICQSAASRPPAPSGFVAGRETQWRGRRAGDIWEIRKPTSLDGGGLGGRWWGSRCEPSCRNFGYIFIAVSYRVASHAGNLGRWKRCDMRGDVWLNRGRWRLRIHTPLLNDLGGRCLFRGADFVPVTPKIPDSSASGRPERGTRDPPSHPPRALPGSVGKGRGEPGVLKSHFRIAHYSVSLHLGVSHRQAVLIFAIAPFSPAPSRDVLRGAGSPPHRPRRFLGALGVPGLIGGCVRSLAYMDWSLVAKANVGPSNHNEAAK